MWDTHMAKSGAYSGHDVDDVWANFRTSEAMGIPAYIGATIRASDKMERIKNLIRNPANQGTTEGLVDGYDDLANYCLIAKDLYLETK